MILLLIDKVTAGTWSLALVIIKPTPVIWSSSAINTQFLYHFKSRSTHFIKNKSRDLQKLLRYLSRIVTSVFNGGTGGCGGCGGWDPSGLTAGSAGRAGLASFFLLFLFYI